MVSAVYHVEGMTCAHCVSAVSDELAALGGVTSVDVDLVVGGMSTVTVTSDRLLAAEEVFGALDEAGDYRLTETPSPGPPQSQGVAT